MRGRWIWAVVVLVAAVAVFVATLGRPAPTRTEPEMESISAVEPASGRQTTAGGSRSTGSERRSRARTAARPSVDAKLRSSTVITVQSAAGGFGGASVRVEDGDGRVRRLTTDASGRVVVPGVRGVAHARADADGWVRSRRKPITIGSKTSLRLSRPMSANGEVFTAAGEPAAGAAVEAYVGGARRARDPRDPDYLTETVVGADGSYAMEDLPAGRTVTLRITWRGHCTKHPQVTLPTEHSVTSLGRVVLVRAQTVAGRVLRPGGEPAEGARVQLSLLHAPYYPLGVRASTTTDASGRFRLEGVPAGEGLISAMAEGLIPASETLDTGAPDGNERLVLRLLRGARLVVVVRTVNGAPEQGGRVYFGTEISPQSPPKFRHLGGGRHEAVLLVPGKDYIHVSAKGHAPQKLVVDLAEGADETRTVVLRPAASISGVVRDDTGDPVAGAIVVANDLAVQTHTGSDGAFLMDGVAEGRATLRVWHDECLWPVEDTVVTAPASGVALTVRRAARVTARLLDADGEPIHAYVRYEIASLDPDHLGAGPSGSTRAKDGAVEVSGLRPGRHTVRLEWEEHAPATTEVTVRGSEAADLGTIRLQRGLALRGLVLGDDGRPIEGVRVWAPEFDHYKRLATTDAAGTFELHHLPRGPVELQFSAAGHVGQRPTVEVRPGGPVHEFRLERR